MGTTYVYDFPDLFRRTLEKRWDAYRIVSPDSLIPTEVLEYDEYVLSKEGNTLCPVFRDKGLNDCGMVAWVMDMRTPECPEGRKILVIANDITFKIGSFGVLEDDVFFRATEYAREKGMKYLNFNAQEFQESIYQPIQEQELVFVKKQRKSLKLLSLTRINLKRACRICT